MDYSMPTNVKLDNVSFQTKYENGYIDTSFLSNRLSLLFSLDDQRHTSHKLLQVLAGKKKYRGNIKFNDICVDLSSYSDKIGYIPETDYSYSTITPYEKLMFACSLRYHKIKSKKEQHAIVKYIILKLKINDYDKHNGSLIKRSLSALDHKLTEVGVKCIYNPNLLLLENPTVNMNTYVSIYFLNTIKFMLENDTTIIVSMNSVNNQMFCLFDDVTFLSQGKVIYSGKVSSFSRYLHDIGYPCNEKDDMIHYFTYITQNPHIQLIFDDVWETFTSNNNDYAYRPLENYYQQNFEFRPQYRPNTIYSCNEFICLLEREVKYCLRNDRSHVFEIFVILLFNVFIGILFQNTIYWNNTQTIINWSETRFSLVSIILLTNTLILSYPLLSSYKRDFILYKQERHMYSFTRYICVKTLTVTIKTFLFVSIILGINYGFIGLYSNFWHLLLKFSLVVVSVSTFVMCICSILSYGEPIVFGIYFAPQILLCGLVLPVSDIWEYVQSIYYLCLYNYGIQIVTVEEMTVIPQSFPKNQLDILSEVTYGCSYENMTNYICDQVTNTYAIFPRNHIQVENQLTYIYVLCGFVIFGHAFTCIAMWLKK